MTNTSREVSKQLALLRRYATAIAALILFVLAAIFAVRVGLSRLFSEYGSTFDSLSATEQAVQLNAADPEAHYAHAVQLARRAKNDEAQGAFEYAAFLRPRDYFFWQELGRAYDETGNLDRAAESLRKAINLAPHYSTPHWLLGNILLRENRLHEAFQELRLAVTRDPSLFPLVMDFAWATCEGDSKSVLAALEPQNDAERIQLGHFFLAHNRPDDALKLIRSTTAIPADDRQRFISSLIDGGRFLEAQYLWKGGDKVNHSLVFDGGFEGSISIKDRGFGWKPESARQNVNIVLDTNEPHSGQQSLRVLYSGDSDPLAPIISQLVLVSPDTHYRLTLFSRTQDLVSAALPLVTISNASDKRVIAQSSAVGRGTRDWSELSVNFATTTERVVFISVQRERCWSKPCPIFGRVWFDGCALQAVNRVSKF